MIKFRAWDKQSQLMCEVLSIDFIRNKVIEVRRLDGKGTYSMEAKYFEVEQFTGLLDKHGKEIYGNDKMQSKDGLRRYVVAWNERQGNWYLRGISTSWTVNEPTWRDYEIIGTIHDEKAKT